MTLQVEYTANGTSNVFPFPFAIETEADCQVLVNGVPQSGDYCIRGQGSIDGGAVVFDAAPATGLVITLRRRSDLRISAVDAEGGYLADKLLAGDNITLETVTQGGVQRLRIAATGQDVSVAELVAVLKAGANITLTPDGNGRLVVAAKSVDASDLAAVLKAGGNISLQQDASGRLVIAAESVDATELLAVLRAGANVTVTADGAGHVVIAAESVDADELAAVLKAGANVTLSKDAEGRLVVAAAQPDMTNVLYKNVSAVLEKGFWTKPVALNAASGTVTPDLNAGNVFTVTLSASLTLGFPADLTGKAGMFLVVAKQDATGGRTLTLSSGYKLAGGNWSAKANATNLLWVTSDGSGDVLDVVIAQRGA